MDTMGRPAPLYLQDDAWDTDAVAQTKHLVKSQYFMEKDRNLLGAIFRDRDIWVEVTSESIETFEAAEKILSEQLEGFNGISVALSMIRSHLYDLRAAMGHIAMFRASDGVTCVNIMNMLEYYDPQFDWGRVNNGSFELALNILNAFAPVFDDPEREIDEAEYEEFAGFSIRSAVMRCYKQFAIDVIAKIPEHGGVITVDEIHHYLREHGVRPEQLDFPPKNCRYWG